MIMGNLYYSKRNDANQRITIGRKSYVSFLRWIALSLWITATVLAGTSESAAQAIEIPAPERKAADPKQEKSTYELPSSSEITKRIEDIKEHIKTAKSAENEQKAQQIGVTLADLQERTSLLKATQTAYERLQTALKKVADLKEEEARVQKNLQPQIDREVDQNIYYSLSSYDALLDELAALQQQGETTALAVKLAKSALEDATVKLDKAQKEWRNIKDKVETAPEKARPSRLIWDLEMALLERDFREVMIHLERVNIENLTRQSKISGLNTDLVKQKISWAKGHLNFDESDLTKQLESLENRREALRKRIKNISEAQEKAETNLMITSGQLRESPGEKRDATIEAVLKEKESWLKTYQELREQTEEMILLLGYQEQFWRTRYDLLKGGAFRDDAMGQEDELETKVKNINRLLDVQESHQSSLRSQISALEKKLTEENLDPKIRPHLKNRLKAAQKLAEGRLEYISLLLATQNMARRTLSEISQSTAQVSLKEKFTELISKVQDVWDFEILVIDNRPVTIKKLITAFIILIVGILIARYILRVIGNRFFAYARIKESTALGILKVFRYLAYLLVLILALRMVNIPLAAFAFLGGAIAIGLGFGAQNLINNFISGFIIMGERPINIGNIVEVDGVLGQIEEIGARSTRIRTGENIHILVPNSSFLEKNITNWTLSDRQIRAHVKVGVRYGSQVQEVERLLLESVRGKDKVLKSPEPFVIFEDFGDNALIFQVHFWISITRIIERRLIESSIRFEIDKKFREADIVIAFPQRDVHFDSQTPLEFRLIDQKDD